MFGFLVMASAIGLAGQPASASPMSHVRTTEPQIARIVATGIARSATFRRLIDTMNASDVIVYLEPKLSRSALSGYLAHRVVAAGTVRYVKIAVDLHGGEDRLVGLVAHELQHAVEVAQAPSIRDSAAMVRLFEQ